MGQMDIPEGMTPDAAMSWPPQELIELDSVVLTPHVGGWSPEAVQNSVDRFIANMRSHLDGKPLVSPI